MGRIFGTDGARGVANTEISCELAMNIGRAAAMVTAERIGRQPVFLIGKDTRLSSDMLEAAVCAGLCSVGADVIMAGVLPTPAVSLLITKSHADAGVMLSASHNPYEFNGIKVFGNEGFKLTDAEEFEIEQIVLDKVKPYLLRWGWEIGGINRGENLLETYLEHLRASVQQDVSGMRVALDCSNGSAAATAARLFEMLGVKAHIVGNQPDGRNINRDCGSTHIETLCRIVQDGGYDVGFAFDGDADRCLAVDEKGQVVDGDEIMAILAVDMKRRGALCKDTLVATVMSNLGLFKFAEREGIHVEKTKVGDRYVLEKMLRHGYNLGGEQSGHVIQLDHLQTGDGQLTAIQLLNVLAGSGKPMSELASVMEVYPQVMVNMQADADMKRKLDVDAGVKKIVEDVEATLGSNGRILIRPSGTEPLIRVMIEGQNKDEIQKLVDETVERLQERLSVK